MEGFLKPLSGLQKGSPGTRNKKVIIGIAKQKLVNKKISLNPHSLSTDRLSIFPFFHALNSRL